MEQARYKDKKYRWYVLRHQDPELIDLQLQSVNKKRTESEDGGREIHYIVPYVFMKPDEKPVVPDPYSDSDSKTGQSLRSVFRHFVFIYDTEEQIDRLLMEGWNREGQNHLHFFRSYYGKALWVKDSDMKKLLQLFLDRHGRYTLEVAEPDLLVNEQVVLKDDTAMKGTKVKVLDVLSNGTGVHLTLGVPMFDGNYMLKFHNKSLSDIEVPDHLEKYFSFTSDMMAEIDKDLIGILRNRVKGKGEEDDEAESSPPMPKAEQGQPQQEPADSNKEPKISDSEILNNYSILNCLKFEDIALNRHLHAQMLLCAALRKDERGIGNLVPVVEGYLSDTRMAATAEEAFMMAVLFVATDRVSYRHAAKDYVQTHNPISEPLSSIMPVVKRYKVRGIKMKLENKEIQETIEKQSSQTLDALRKCKFDRLSPQGASAVGKVLSLGLRHSEEGGKLFQNLVDEVEKRYKRVRNVRGKSEWLLALYSLSGVYDPQAYSDVELQDKCDRYFDDLFAKAEKQGKQEEINDRLRCCRRLSLLQRCRQWLNSLSDAASPQWQTMPLKDILQRLWVLGALDAKTLIESDDTISSTDVWREVLACFGKCHQALRRQPTPDAETLALAYQVLVFLYPDSKPLPVKDLYDEFIEMALRLFPTLHYNGNDWWQVKSILEHRYHRKEEYRH